MSFASITPAEKEDLALIERTVHGDKESFSMLVRKYQKFVYTTAYAIVPNREDANDISQETFLKAFRFLSLFRGECKFSSWLYRICTNTAHDFMRSAARRPQVVQAPAREDDDSAEIDIPAPAEETAPEEILERSALREAVQRAIASLPPEYRSILTLRDINGCSYEEIASLLHLNTGTVKSRINRARSSVRKMLKSGNFLERDSSNEKKSR